MLSLALGFLGPRAVEDTAQGRGVGARGVSSQWQDVARICAPLPARAREQALRARRRGDAAHEA
eukprot:6049565-Lingulodinium_polyedra.AAC.1